jgi:hypothetical protein
MDDKEFYNSLPEYVIRIQKEHPLDFNEEELEKLEVKQKRTTLSAIKLSNGDIYQGEWNKCMKMEGLGLMLKAVNAKVLEGIWKDENLIKGRIYFADETYYEGQISNEQPNGEGTFYGLGFTYMGEYKFGKKHGQGRIIFNDSTKFSGRFEDDEAVNGNIVWPNGCSYEGDVKNFTLGPNGIFTTILGNIYQGSWVNNKLDGLGKFTWKSPNHVFEGHYKKNKKEGPGVYYFNYPSVFLRGSWLHDKPHGPGEYQDEKKIVIGLWRYGRLLQVYSYTLKENTDINTNLSEKSDHKLSVKEIEDEMNLKFQKEDVDTKSLPHLKHEYDYSHSPNQMFKAINADKDIFSSKQADSIQSSILSSEKPVEAQDEVKTSLQKNLEKMTWDKNLENPKPKPKELTYSQIHDTDSLKHSVNPTTGNDNFNQIFKVQEVAYVPDYKNNELYEITRKQSS